MSALLSDRKNEATILERHAMDSHKKAGGAGEYVEFAKEMKKMSEGTVSIKGAAKAGTTTKADTAAAKTGTTTKADTAAEAKVSSTAKKKAPVNVMADKNPTKMPAAGNQICHITEELPIYLL